MKDYFYIWMLARTHEFKGDGLTRAIAATFSRRDTEIPNDVPEGLTADFANDPAKIRQWQAFARNIEIAPPDLEAVVEEIAAFLTPHTQAAKECKALE